MGLFTKKSPAEKLAQKQQKTAAELEKKRQMAEKAGVEVEGSVAFDHCLGEDMHICTLVVWPDRVELYDHGKATAVLFKEPSSTVIPLDKLSSVAIRRDGMWHFLTLTVSNREVEYRCYEPDAHRLKDVIQELMFG